MQDSSFKASLFYDGHCSVCRKVKTIIRIADIQKNVRLIDLWSIGSSLEFKNLSMLKLTEEIHLIDRSGKIYPGYFAFKQIAKIVVPFFPLYLLSFLPGIDSLGVKVYKFISKNRY